MVGIVVNDSDPSGLRACQFPFGVFVMQVQKMFYSKSAILTGSCYCRKYAITGLFYNKGILEFLFYLKEA